MFKELFESSDDQELMKLVLKNFGDNKFGKKGVLPYKSKNYGTYQYNAPSKIPGVIFSTGWGHQAKQFIIEINDSSKGAQLLDTIKGMNLSDSIDIYNSRGTTYVTFEQNNKYTNRLVSEFADSFYGYSDDDL